VPVDRRRDGLAELDVLVTGQDTLLGVHDPVVRAEDGDVEGALVLRLDVGDARRWDVGVVALTSLEAVVRGVGISRRLERDRVEAVVPGLTLEVAGPLIV